jgi:hypothetical protein
VTGQSYPGFGPYDSDVDGGRTTVYSQPYDLSGAEIAEVKYWRWYTNDLGTSPGLDTWLVQARNNGGTWTDLENTTASDNSWTFHRFDLLALFGAGIGTVEFRFRASDTGAGSLVEAAVDEFELQTASPQGIATWDGGADRFAFLGGRPNPARGRVEIGFRIPVPSSVRLEVFDVSGRRLRVVADRPFNSGLHTVRWDGRDAGGRAAPGGVYYLRMSTGGFSSTRPVTFLP